MANRYGIALPPEKTCYLCFSRYRNNKKTSKYCGTVCRNIAFKGILNVGSKGLSGQFNPMFKNGNNAKTFKSCVNCGNQYFGLARSKFCSRRCLGVARQLERYNGVNGEANRKRLSEVTAMENNPRWRGGASIQPYASGFVNGLKAKIRQRDANCCVTCHRPNSSGALAIHHIDGSKTNHQPNNLITLCRKCHGKVHGNTLSLLPF